jgi:uncharacterized protein YggE
MTDDNENKTIHSMCPSVRHHVQRIQKLRIPTAQALIPGPRGTETLCLAATVLIVHASAMTKLVLLALTSLPLSVLAQSELPDKPYIYVQGQAVIEKPADIVTLRFDVVARNPDQAKANQEVQAKATKILSLLNEKKIAEGDVIAADVKAEPEFEEDNSGRRTGKLIDYTVTRGFQVKVRDLPTFPKLVDELIGITGVKFSELDAGLAKEKEIQQEFGTKRWSTREQADKTAKAMGVKIDSVLPSRRWLSHGLPGVCSESLTERRQPNA